MGRQGPTVSPLHIGRISEAYKEGQETDHHYHIMATTSPFPPEIGIQGWSGRTLFLFHLQKKFAMLNRINSQHKSIIKDARKHVPLGAWNRGRVSFISENSRQILFQFFIIYCSRSQTITILSSPTGASLSMASFKVTPSLSARLRGRLHPSSCHQQPTKKIIGSPTEAAVMWRDLPLSPHGGLPRRSAPATLLSCFLNAS